MLVAADAGADDIEDLGDTWQVTTPPTELHAVRTAIEAAGFTTKSADLTMIPTTSGRARRREPGEDGVAAHGRARGPRRRRSRVRELRHPRRSTRGGPVIGQSIREPDGRDRRAGAGLHAARASRTASAATTRSRSTAAATSCSRSIRATTRPVARGRCARTATTGREFERLGAVLLGISPQDVDSHEKLADEAATSRSRCSPTSTRR